MESFLPDTAVAVVTGANKGIGLSIVRRLCKALPKGNVVLTARNADLGQAAVATLKAEGLSPCFHQLDISDDASVETLRAWLDKEHGGIHLLVNNAGIAFKMQDATPFAQQARRSVDVNYYGTKRVTLALLPVLRPGGRIVAVSSQSGSLSSWSAERRTALLATELDLDGLDRIAEEFVAAAEAGNHKQLGFPGSAYGSSKALVTQLQRILARESAAGGPALIAACCPGLCRTDMSTSNTMAGWAIWAASFAVGGSADWGADTPAWLGAGLKAEECQSFHGRLVYQRKVIDY